MSDIIPRNVRYISWSSYLEMPQAVGYVALCNIDIIFGKKNYEYELQEFLHVRNHAMFAGTFQQS